MKYLLQLATLFWFASGHVADAASALVMPDGSSVLIVAEDGQLQLWKPKEAAPRWKLQLGGFASGARSRVADIALRGNGNILVAERCGRIVEVSPDGRVISRKLPLYEYVRLGVEVGEVDWSNWSGQVAEIACTAAAKFSDDAKFVYLVPDEWSTVLKVPLGKFMEQPGEHVQLSESLIFQFADRNIVIDLKIGPVPFEIGHGWIVGEDLHATALGVCDGIIIAGAEEGSVVLTPEVGDQDREQRIRQVGNREQDIRSILDVGCLPKNLAYTVSFDTGYGQIQLWDLNTKAVLDYVGLDSSGHPGMAFVAVGSTSGEQLLSLGDGDVRIWSIEHKHLKLLSRYFVQGSTQRQAFAAAALSSGDFIVWDGARLWRYVGGGDRPTLYAGK